MNTYPEWKVTLWRGLRGAVATVIATAGLALQETVTGVNIINVDFSSLEAIMKTLTVPFVAGFLIALGKGLRDAFGAKDQKSLIDKLPL